MRNAFPLFQSHLDIAHDYWRRTLALGDTAIDATCGNGYDTLALCEMVLSHNSGEVIAMDIQEEAIKTTGAYLREKLDPLLLKRVKLVQGSHAQLPAIRQNVKLIVYNLGYLPKGDKAITTTVESTLKSLSEAQKLIAAGGAISVTCYPGHEEGALEEKALVQLVSQWDPKVWSCCYHQWINRCRAPSLLFIQKMVG